MSELLFDDFFKIVDVNPNGEKYDKGMLISHFFFIFED